MMENFKKAEEFYLRGFCGEYIKRRTGVSIQRLLKHLLAQGVTYTKADIVAYQIDYIQQRYTVDDVKSAYCQISEKYPDLSKASHGKHVECLGCGFGEYPKVFSALLGAHVYKDLRVQCWSKKQKKTMQEQYGVTNAFEKGAHFLKENPMYSATSKEKRRQTMLARYGCEHPNQNMEIKQRMLQHMKETNLKLYGVENAMQNSKIAYKSAENRQVAMMEKYGAPNSVQIESIRNQIFDSRRKNGTLNSSKAEDVLYEMLVAVFGESDVCRNVIVDNRYPYHVDFYIKSRDLFIELNGDKCHYTHWFDENNEQDMQVLASWQENMYRLEAKTGKKSRYRKYIETWTISDVLKRSSAKKYHLNYLVFWDGSRKIRKGNCEFPRLQDARAWFTDGCPDSKDWYPDNTY